MVKSTSALYLRVYIFRVILSKVICIVLKLFNFTIKKKYLKKKLVNFRQKLAKKSLMFPLHAR